MRKFILSNPVDKANKKQKVALGIGCFLILVHLILYFPNVHKKYKKLQLVRSEFKARHNESVIVALQDREETFKKAFMAWFIVTMFLVFGTALSWWFFRDRASVN